MSTLGKLGSNLLSGLLIINAPMVVQAFIAEELHNLKFSDVVLWVREGRSLWEAIPKANQEWLQKLGPKLGDVTWLTADWTMEAGKESAPSLYSLFQSEPSAKEWLERQAEEIRNKVKGVGTWNQKSSVQFPSAGNAVQKRPPQPRPVLPSRNQENLTQGPSPGSGSR